MSADVDPKFIKHISEGKVNGIDQEFNDVATLTFTGQDGLPEGRASKRHRFKDVTAVTIREVELAAQRAEDSQAVTVGSPASPQSQPENAGDTSEDNSGSGGMPGSTGEPSWVSGLSERRRSIVWRIQLRMIEQLDHKTVKYLEM